MKGLSLILISVLTTLTVSSLALAGELDGLEFCRYIHIGDRTGQPERTFLHCVSFFQDTATDNANSYFGNPPESFRYSVKGRVIVNLDTGKPTPYVKQGNDLSMVGTGAVLTRQ